MGVEKEVIRPGTDPKPTLGQIVTVHCTGYAQRIQDNNLSLSKLARDQLLKDGMGMQVGEVARLKCTPDYAYGAGGFSAWGIQPNSSLHFEIKS